MKSIHLYFIGVVVIIAIFFSLFFYRLHVSDSPKEIEISEFKLVNISEQGHVFSDLAMKIPVNLKTIHYSNETYLKTDSQAAAEFLCFGVLFTILPDSILHFQPKTNELCFFEGELYWHREDSKQKAELLIKNSIDEADRASAKILTISDSGRMIISKGMTKIWNYSGNLRFAYENNQENLVQLEMLVYRDKQPISKNKILPAPESAAPEFQEVSLEDFSISNLKLNWKTVQQASDYLIRLYTSNLRENKIHEEKLKENYYQLDFLKFRETNRIYWEVYPFDARSDLEGVPAKMGLIRVKGSYLISSHMLKPPYLEIAAMTISGNMVLIQGKADAESKMYVSTEMIENDQVKIDMDGKFIHTIAFKTLGTKEIIFRLVSKAGVETIKTKQVKIFAE